MLRSSRAVLLDPRPAAERGRIAIRADAFAPTHRGTDGVRGRAVDLFAGAGGFGLGLSLAGWTVTAAVERDAWASETLRENHPGCNVVTSDITKLTDLELETIVGSADLIVGGPPCQGFSVANDAAGDPTDPRNSLFREFVRAVSLTKPRAFVMENVPGLLRRTTASGRPVLEIVCESFQQEGYSVRSTILEGCNFGVPQLRPHFVHRWIEGAAGKPIPETHTRSLG